MITGSEYVQQDLPSEMNIEEPEQTTVTEPEEQNEAANILPIPTELDESNDDAHIFTTEDDEYINGDQDITMEEDLDATHETSMLQQQQWPSEGLEESGNVMWEIRTIFKLP